MMHFIWVFTVYKSTHLGVSRIQRVKRLSVFAGMAMLFSKAESFVHFCKGIIGQFVHWGKTICAILLEGIIGETFV